MTWTVGAVVEKADYRWDRPDIRVPFIQVDTMPLIEWEKENPQTLKGGGPVAFIDAETWRDFDKPAFFGCLILDRIGGQTKKICGEDPSRWNWKPCDEHKKSHKKEVREACDICVRVKPKTAGRSTTVTNKHERLQRMTRVWCHSDELETHLIPILMERDVKIMYAHNATVDLIAMLSSIEPDIYHPFEMFLQNDPEEFSKLLFKGSTILKADLDFAPYYNRHNPQIYSRDGWDRATKRKAVKHDYPMKMIDSLGVLPLPLAAIGEAVGFPKGETPNKFKDPEDPDFGNFMSLTDDDVRYCLQDCEVLFHGLNTLFQVAKELGYRGDAMPLTSGTLGAQMIATANIESVHLPKLYQKKKGSKWKYRTITNNPDLDDVARLSMVGGRTQAFVTDPVTQEAWGIDSNSAYASAQTNTNNPFPDFRNMNGSKNPDEITPEIFKDFEGCVYVHWIRPEHDLIGMFCARNSENLLDWVMPESRRWITFPEYRKALELGYALTVEVCPDTGYCAILCERLPYNLFECVLKWYNARLDFKKNNDPREFCVKQILCAGGFGKYVERNQNMIITTEEDWAFMPEDWAFTSVVDDGARVYGYATQGAETETYERADTTANLCGSYITAYARIDLYEVMTEIGHDHILYVDTDSVKHTNPEAICPKEGSALGEWKLEQVYDYWESPRPKQYKYHQTWDEKNGNNPKWKARIKGCSLNKAAEEMGIDYEAFAEQVDLKGDITFERVVGIKEGWRGNNPDRKSGTWVKTTKSIGGK